jgi:hypothetical protein
MNYIRIHNFIIERARSRTHDPKIHQKHHIIPRHEDPSSTETVPLTLKEHRVIHLLRWKITSTSGNKLAYLIMKHGQNSIEARRLLSSMGGKIGGAKTRETNAGIFSESWDRSAETKRRWVEDIISREAQSNLMKSGLASRAGSNCVKSGKGIYSKEWDRSENNRNVWAALSEENRIARSNISKANRLKGTRKSQEMKANFSGWDKEKHKQVCSNGGKSHVGKKWITNGLENMRCLEENIQEFLLSGWVYGRTMKGSTK